MKSQTTSQWKSCDNCKQPLIRKKRTSGVWESPLQFSRRRFCNRACMGEHKAKRPAEVRAKARGRYYAQQMIAASQCELCETMENLIRHHRDENPTNNDPSNLQVLCRPCHNSLHKELRGLVCRVCGGKNYAKGYCHTHYNRWKKHGNPLVKCVNTRRGIPASVPT